MPLRFSALVFTPPPSNPPFSTQIRLSTTILLAQIPIPPAHNISARLRITSVRGDGRCLYRAIAKNLAALEDRPLSERLERADADALRALAWKAMCVDRLKEFQRNNAVEGSLTSYCRAMRSPTFYAGEAEMLALVDVLQVPIAVFIQVARGELRNIATYGAKYGKKGGPGVRVLYVNGNHYDAILPR